MNEHNFQWDDDTVREYGEWYRITQGKPPPHYWGEDLLEVFKKSIKRKALFCLPEGQMIYEGDVWYSVNESFEILENKTTEGHVPNPQFAGKRFLTKEEAEEYILMSRQVFSVNDILEWHSRVYRVPKPPITGWFYQSLVSLAKEKTK